MSLFICSNCSCVENTALCGYWWKGDAPALCSSCDPATYKWHGLFPKKKATEVEVESIEGGFIKRVQSKGESNV